MTQVPDTNPTWTSLENLLASADELAKGSLDLDRFHAQLLELLVEGLAVDGGAVWVEMSEGRWEAACQIRPESVELATRAEGRRLHLDILEKLFGRPHPYTIPARGHDGTWHNATDHRLYFQPLTCRGKTMAVLELFQRERDDSLVVQGVQQVLSAVDEIAGSCYLQHRLQQLEASNREAVRLEQFLERIFRPEGQRAAAYVVVNEARQLLPADRVSLCERRGDRCRMLAASGVDRVERRAGSVRAAEALARSVLAAGPLWYPTDHETLAPQLEQVLEGYLESTAAASVAALPLAVPQRDEEDAVDGATASLHSDVCGVIIFDWFQDAPDTKTRRRMQHVQRYIALALHRAQLHDRLPLVGVARVLRDIGWQRGNLSWRHGLAMLGVLCGLAILLAVLPAELTVSATGRLEPRERADVFAPRSGVVMEVPARHGQRVEPGDILAVLRSAELDRQLNETVGRLRTVEETLSALRTTRLQQGRGAADGEETGRLAAQEVELEVTRRGLREQWQLLEEQRNDLTLTSPLAGQVVTWDVQHLTARPVPHGEFLMRVARLEGAWMLELDVPESRIGHILRARAESSNERELRVEYLLEAAPVTSYHGRLAAVADATHLSALGLPVVLAEVTLPPDDLPGPRPGATVHARIFCGRRSLGYVWFHRVYEAVWMTTAQWF